MDQYKLHWTNDGKDEYDDECRANSVIEDMKNLEMMYAEVHRSNYFNYHLYL